MVKGKVEFDWVIFDTSSAGSIYAAVCSCLVSISSMLVSVNLTMCYANA